jgi:hypothetical protein
MANIVARKAYPDGYPVDALQILSKMSFSDGKNVQVVGSMALRSQVYAGDYDATETVQVKSLAETARKFKEIVRALEDTSLTYIGDIKSGSVEEWKVVDTHYNYSKSQKKLDELRDLKIITTEEHRKGTKLLKPYLTKLELLEARRELRFHIIRWKPADVLKGYKILVDGRKFTLEDAFQTPTITKVDVVSWVQNNRFTDFSIIYTFKRGTKVLNPGMGDIEQSIRENIYVLKHEGNYFKMAKRMFALARLKGYTRTMKLLSSMFNGDLGRLYIVYGDLGTLESMFESTHKLPYEKIEFELDQFHGRLSNIGLPKYLNAEKEIIQDLDELMDTRERSEGLEKTKKLKEKLYHLLTFYTKEYLNKHHIMP